MQFPIKKEGVKAPHIFNAPGFGKAGNNAIDILISKRYFKDLAVEDFDLGIYKELTKKLYKADLEAQQEIKEEYR